MSKKIMVFMIMIAILVIAGIFVVGTSGKYTDRDGKYKHVSPRNSYGYVENHPIFEEWGDKIIVWDSPVFEKFVKPLSYNYLNLFLNYDLTNLFDGINFMIDKTNDNSLQIYHFYSREEMMADPTKEKSGLYYIPGDKDKPYCIVVAGGAFKSVALFNESFPVAKELSDQGYPVFVLMYRVTDSGEDDTICFEDVAASMKYIQLNYDKFGIENTDYSMWGFSAGGRLIYNWAEGDIDSVSSTGLKAPYLLALCYPALWDTDENLYPHIEKNGDMSIYICYGANDSAIGEKGINWAKEHEEILKAEGVNIYFELDDNAEHGFGNGAGTDADGWIERALNFAR